jgi:hypothetical protein
MGIGATRSFVAPRDTLLLGVAGALNRFIPSPFSLPCPGGPTATVAVPQALGMVPGAILTPALSKRFTLVASRHDVPVCASLPEGR